MDLENLAEETRIVLADLIKRSDIKKGQIFVLGLSSCEVAGGIIGKNSNLDIGEVIVKTILTYLNDRGINLAVQGCEHLNRALVGERELADKRNLEIVNVLPNLHAGGSGQLAAFKYMKDPVEVEEIVADAGLGTINHTVLTISYLNANDVKVQGVILNKFDKNSIMHQDNLSMIEQISNVKVIATLADGKQDLELLDKNMEDYFDEF